MRTSFLIISALLVLSSARTIEVPDSLFSDNYEGFKAFVAGFMKGYEGGTYDISDACLTSESQAKLDQDIVAMFKVLVIGRFEEFGEYFRIFLGDLAAMSTDCGLNEIKRSFDVALQEKGFMTIVMNTTWNFFNIEAAFLDALERLVIAEWENAGIKLGSAVAYIIPPEPLSTLISLASTPEGLLNFTTGLLDGLEENPKMPGKCYQDLNGSLGYVEAVVSDIKRLFGGDISAATQLMGDAMALYRDIQGYETDCNFSGLVTNLKAIFSSGGYRILVERYMLHIIKITEALKGLKVCDQNWHDCGENLAKIIRYEVDWGIN